MRQISAQGLDLLKRLEGFRPFVYDDLTGKPYVHGRSEGTPTIGYGHKVKHNEVFETITEAEASQLLEDDLDEFENFVDKKIPMALNQNQYDALVIFFFNTGTDLRTKRNFYRYLKDGDFINAQGYWMMYIKSKGKIIPGLITRRQQEIALFNKKVDEKLESC